MNDIFNLNRFGLLFKKTVLERPAQLAGLILLALIITFSLFAIAAAAHQWNGAHTQSFVWGYIGGGIILASVVFGYFSTNASGAAYLTLPASAFEKWLCGVLITGVLFTAIFLGFYRFMDYTFITIYHNSLDKGSPMYRQLYDKAFIYEFDSRIPLQAYAIFLNLAGIMMLGSLYFNKAGFIKTALSFAAFIFIIYIINSVMAHAIFPGVSGAMPFDAVFMKVGETNSYRNLTFSETPATIRNTIWTYILPAILWVTVYIRLREKEI